MLYPHFGVCIFLWRFRNHNLDGVNVAFRFSENVAFLHVFGYIDF